MTNKTQHIAIYGGAFDPPHAAHAAIVNHLADMDWVDCICIMPYAHSPFNKTPVASANDRIAMLHLLFDKLGKCQIDTHETHDDSITYTVDTLQHYQQVHPHAKLFLVLSSESLASLMQWKQPDIILAACHIICFQRQGEHHPIPDALQSRLTDSSNDLVQQTAGKILLVKPNIPKHSSSEIRDKLPKNEPLNGAIDARVLAYIQEHQLYTIR